MSDGDDRFLFGDDAESRERARRYAERQARRGGTPVPPPDDPEPDPKPEPEVETKPEPVKPTSPDEPPRADEPASASEADAAPAPPEPPSETSLPLTGEESSVLPLGRQTIDFGFDEPPQTAEQALAAQRQARRHEDRGSRRPTKTRARQALGILAVLALLGLVVAAAYAGSKLVGGDDAANTTTTDVVEMVPTQSVLIPEGMDRRAIAKVARQNDLEGNYLKQTRSAPKGFNMKKYGAEDAPNLEGFLFPATYDIPEDKLTTKQLINQQLDAFEDNIAGVDMTYAESRNLTVYDVVIIASLIEREIMVPEERKLAAGVIYNRLRAGMTLGIDATIRFEDNNWTEPLVQSRLDTNTPYNTRLNAGLPPTPIGNPGLASLEAAANPSKKNFLFYVVKPNTCGEHVFVETEAEFAAATAEYHAAREANGGQAPTPDDC